MLDRERLSAITDNVVYDEPMSKHTTFRIVYAYGQRLKYACR